jgi:hypothetical protein
VDWPHEMISIKFPIEDFHVVWMCLSDVKLREYGSRMQVNNSHSHATGVSLHLPNFFRMFYLGNIGGFGVALMQACSYFPQTTLVDVLGT